MTVNLDWQTPAAQPADRAARLAYLKGHPRFFTMHPWNRSTSYARCWRQALPADLAGRDELLHTAEALAATGLDELLAAFHEGTDRCWLLAFNGDGNSHLVLYPCGLDCHTVVVYPGRGVDDPDTGDDDFDAWSDRDVESRAGLVWAFDRTFDEALKRFAAFCRTHTTEEVTALTSRRPRRVRRTEQ